MAYEFQAVDISLFDFHLMIDPLFNAASINSAFSFLADSKNYNQQYQSGAVVQTPDIAVLPLQWRALSYHHFWKYYQTIWAKGGAYDFWKLQMPFIVRSKQTRIKLNSPVQDFVGTVHPVIFLTGMGWSTNLE